MRAFENVLIEEEMPSSLVVLINCKSEKIIRDFIDLLKVSDRIFGSCDTSRNNEPQSMLNEVIGNLLTYVLVQQRQEMILSLSLSLS